MFDSWIRIVLLGLINQSQGVNWSRDYCKAAIPCLPSMGPILQSAASDKERGHSDVPETDNSRGRSHSLFPILLRRYSMKETKTQGGFNKGIFRVASLHSIELNPWDIFFYSLLLSSGQGCVRQLLTSPSTPPTPWMLETNMRRKKVKWLVHPDFNLDAIRL